MQQVADVAHQLLGHRPVEAVARLEVAARTSGGTPRSDENGEPGARRITKNDTTTITSNVGTRPSKRRSDEADHGAIGLRGGQALRGRRSGSASGRVGAARACPRTSARRSTIYLNSRRCW